VSNYRQVRNIDHPRVAAGGYVYEHVLIAERALGHALPPGAHVHHVDGDKSNNANANLVICQDNSYHKLLHFRARIVRAGHNPNVEKLCCTCKQWKPYELFAKCRESYCDGRHGSCRSCNSANARASVLRRRAG
jgi:hypothetical protein